MTTHIRGRFFYLLADLSRDPKVRDRLSQDPPGLLDHYGISAEAQTVLRSGDSDQIVALISQEAHELIKNARQEQTVMMPWPTHVISVQTCSPGTGAVNTPISFTVTGTLFDKDAKLTFSNPNGSVDGYEVSVQNSGQGQSTMTAKAKFASAGTYDVIVTNPNGDNGTLPAGFSAS